MGARGSLQTYPPQDRPLTTLKELRPFIFYKASHESALTPFWGPPQGAWTRRKAAADGNEAGSAKTAWVGAKGRWGDGSGTDKGSEAWLARRGSKAREATHSLGWAERHGNRAGVDQAQTGVRTAWLGAMGVRWGAGPGSGQVGDLHKLRGPGTKLQQGCARTAWVGAKGLWGDGPGTDKGGWREGAKARKGQNLKNKPSGRGSGTQGSQGAVPGTQNPMMYADSLEFGFIKH